MQLGNGCVITPDFIDIMAIETWWPIVLDRQLKHMVVQD